MPDAGDDARREQLHALDRALVDRARDLALFLVYDRPERVGDRPGLARTYFAQRCISDAELTSRLETFRAIGAYVELFDGEHPLFEALANGRVLGIDRPLKVVYNGIESCVASEAFQPGRKALLPSVADAYGLLCANSNAYGCALGRHKFHYLTVLRSLGVRTPRVWHYRPSAGWAGGRAPSPGARVITKSTYESWSVGVTEDSIFTVDGSCQERVASIADAIGQPVTVQEFISGPEVNVPVLSFPDTVVTPPVEAVLAKAPGSADAVVTIDDNLREAGLAYKRFDAPAEVIEPMRRTAREAFHVLELQSFARIDFRVDANGGAWVIDIGVDPGLSLSGSAARSFAALGLDHPSFLRVVIAATLASGGVL